MNAGCPLRVAQRKNAEAVSTSALGQKQTIYEHEESRLSGTSCVSLGRVDPQE